MSIQEDLNLRFQERIARTEERVDNLDEAVEKHAVAIDGIGKQLNTLVTEVGKIRNAIYVLAAAAAAQIPALKGIVDIVRAHLL